MSKSSLFIFGGSSTALEIAEAVALVHSEIDCFFVVGDQENSDYGNRIADGALKTFLMGRSGEQFFILSQSNSRIRQECLARAADLSLRPFTVVHPQAWISDTATLGEGVYVGAGACISAQARIADHSMLNMGMVFGHDAQCESHFVGSPGCVVGGNVRLGARVFIGANAFVRQGLGVGSDSQVDAVTYVHKDIGDRKLCADRNLVVVNRFDLG